MDVTLTITPVLGQSSTLMEVSARIADPSLMFVTELALPAAGTAVEPGTAGSITVVTKVCTDTDCTYLSRSEEITLPTPARIMEVNEAVQRDPVGIGEMTDGAWLFRYEETPAER